MAHQLPNLRELHLVETGRLVGSLGPAAAHLVEVRMVCLRALIRGLLRLSCIGDARVLQASSSTGARAEKRLSWMYL